MHLVGPFLRRVFEEQGASVEPQLFVLACAVSASQPGIFDTSEPGFLKMMLKAAQTKASICVSCAYFIGQNKQALQSMLKAPDGIAFFKTFLKAKSDNRLTFTEALAQVCTSSAVNHQEMVRRIFSNVTSPDNFPNPGHESKSVEWALENARVPFEGEQEAVLLLFQNLTAWEFGIKALFQNPQVVDYLTDRTHIEGNAICLLKYDIVTTGVQSPADKGLVPAAALERLVEYKQGGVYGENLRKEADP